MRIGIRFEVLGGVTIRYLTLLVKQSRNVWCLHSSEVLHLVVGLLVHRGFLVSENLFEDGYQRVLVRDQPLLKALALHAQVYLLDGSIHRKLYALSLSIVFFSLSLEVLVALD